MRRSVVFRAIEPVAVFVLIGSEVNLADAGRLGDHTAGSGHSLVEPRCALIELIVELRALRGIEHEREVPARAFGIMGLGQAFLEIVRFGHRFANERRFREQSGLPGVGCEGFAFLDAKRHEHGHKKPIPFVDGFALDDGVQALPVFHPARRGLSPTLAGDVHEAG